MRRTSSVCDDSPILTAEANHFAFSLNHHGLYRLLGRIGHGSQSNPLSIPHGVSVGACVRLGADMDRGDHGIHFGKE